MATPVTMPRQGQSVETCIITTWYKKTGENVKTGDLLFSYETDKAAFDMESPADGMLLDTFFAEGAEVPVLVNVAVIGSPGESAEQFRPSGSQPAAPTEAEVGKEEMKQKAVADATSQPAGHDGKIRISPRARAMAQAKGIDIYTIIGTGPGGRIIAGDIGKASLVSGAEKQTLPKPDTGSRLTGSSYHDQPLSNVRKIISKAMHSSLQNSAQLTHHMSADVRKLMALRKKIKSDISSGQAVQDITLNDMICFAVVKALSRFPEMNSHFLDDRIRTFGNVNLGLAVDTSRGLMVPAVINADGMDLATLSRELKRVSEACRKGNIDPELLKSTSASFTVSNLGNYGVEMFTPVINLPQTGILGVCTITYRPGETGDGLFGFIPVIGLSLTYDHRAVDGGPATLFLKEIKNNIESFSV